MPVQVNAQQPGEQIDQHRLHQRAQAGGECLAQHQCHARRRADEQLVHHAEIAFPDDADAVENGEEQNALRENSRRHEIEIAQIAGRHGAQLGKDVAENQQPQRWLHCARQKIGRIAAQFEKFNFHQREALRGQAEQRGDLPRGFRRRFCPRGQGDFAFDGFHKGFFSKRSSATTGRSGTVSTQPRR